MNDDQRVCFVVMGFGQKTAYSKHDTPRPLGLDATYELIVKPAVEAAGIRCIRAGQLSSSG